MRIAYQRILFVTDGDAAGLDGPSALGLRGGRALSISVPLLRRAGDDLTAGPVPSVARTIADVALEAAAELVVLGPCPGCERTLLARLAVAVQRGRAAGLPVAVLGAGTAPVADEGAVLAAVDGGDETPEVLKAALRLANTSQTQIVIAHVGTNGLGAGADLLVQTIAEEFGVRGVRTPGIVIHQRVPVPDQLASTADRIGAEAIVLGWDHRSPAPGTGVVEGVAQRSRRPLLLAPAAPTRSKRIEESDRRPARGARWPGRLAPAGRPADRT